MVPLNFIAAQLLRSWRVLTLSPRAAEGFGNSRQLARLSLLTLLFEFPYTILTAYVTDIFYIDKFGVSLSLYFFYRLWGYVLRYGLTLWLVRVMAGWEGAGDKFYRWMIGYNWLNVLTDILIFPLFLVSVCWMWPREPLIIMGTSTYIFIIYSYWALSWRTLGVNPFYAAGIGMVPVFVGDMVMNYANLKMYGSIRPFFDLP